MISYTDNIKSSAHYVDSYDVKIYHDDIIIKQATLNDYLILVKENYNKHAIYEYIDTDNYRLHISLDSVYKCYEYNSCPLAISTYEQAFDSFKSHIQKFENFFGIKHCINVITSTKEDETVNPNNPSTKQRIIHMNCNIYYPYKISKFDMYTMINVFFIEYPSMISYINILQYTSTSIYHIINSNDIINYQLIPDKGNQDYNIMNSLIQYTGNLPNFVHPKLKTYFWDDPIYLKNCIVFSNKKNTKILAYDFIIHDRKEYNLLYINKMKKQQEDEQKILKELITEKDPENKDTLNKDMLNKDPSRPIYYNNNIDETPLPNNIEQLYSQSNNGINNPNLSKITDKLTSQPDTPAITVSQTSTFSDCCSYSCSCIPTNTNVSEYNPEFDIISEHTYELDSAKLELRKLELILIKQKIEKIKLLIARNSQPINESLN